MLHKKCDFVAVEEAAEAEEVAGDEAAEVDFEADAVVDEEAVQGIEKNVI